MSKTFRQYDSRWGSLGYPAKPDTMANSGCGATACADIVVNNPIHKNATPANTRSYMLKHGYAIRNAGTAWAGISAYLKACGFDVINHASMKTVWTEMAKGNRWGVVLFRGGTRGGVTWTACGHYLAFSDYKCKNGKHYLYMRDPGARKHDGWYCYETTMMGLIPQIWTCSLAKTPIKPKAKKTTAVKKPSALTKRQKFIKALDAYGTEIEKSFRYSNKNSKTTWKAAKTNHITNCARYVSWALQYAGVLSPGKVIYYTNTWKGSGVGQLKSSKSCKVYHPNKVPGKVKLQIGDVCLFQNHTMVYAGKNKAGKRLWYTAGSRDVKNKNVTKVQRASYNKKQIKVLIRIIK